MNAHRDLKCWEITNCENLNCPARSEPETPCWEIAQRNGAYHDISNTCRDCIVPVLKKEASVLGNKEIQDILLHRGLYERIETGYLACA